LGYWNGIEYESKYLDEYTKKTGNIFRLADGLCQVYGDVGFLLKIKEEIETKHNVPLSEEDIEKHNKLKLDKKLNDFVMEVNEELFGVSEGEFNGFYNTMVSKGTIITNKMFEDSVFDFIQTMDGFRKDLRKGKFTGKGKGKKTNLKHFEVIKDFNVKDTDISYKAGWYEWEFKPSEVPVHYQNKYIKKRTEKNYQEWLKSKM
jgi:hypothetical protein